MSVLLWITFCVVSVDAKMLWGTATAAYQVEGHRSADGRQPSIWDCFDTKCDQDSPIKSVNPSGEVNVYHGENAATADDDYVRYADSVHLTHEFGFGAARLSISWPRVMTYTLDQKTMKLSWVRNEDGIQHYKKVLRAYRSSGIQTAVTMFHWDLPLAIEKMASLQPCSSTWLCHTWVADVFAEYAELLLAEYKDLTDWWITINEPLTIVENGYAGSGSHAPGRCGDRSKCWNGNDHVEPYAAAKGMILAHARAFREWEKQGRPGSGCGITLNGDWRIPFTSSEADVAAATRSLEWQAPFFADPLHFGMWPASMEKSLGSRLPRWTQEEVKLVKGAHDDHFFMNSYTTNFARATKDSGCGWGCDSAAETSGYNWSSGAAVGTPSSNGWLFNYGPGLGELVKWYNTRYPGSGFVITENGWGNASSTMLRELEVDDMERCNFYRDYLGNLSAIAVHNSIDVKAYFAWSLMDNYEWADGFSTRFGLTFVNYTTQERTPKMSAKWFQKYITSLAELPKDGEPLPACDKSLLESAPLVMMV